MFRMADALPDNAASAPRAPRSRPRGVSEAGVRRRLKRWLGQLADIGTQLARRVRDGIAHQRAQGAASGTSTVGGIDLTLAHDLVARALRWSGALCVRLAAETAAAKAASKLENRWREPPERLNDWDERDDDVSWIGSMIRRAHKARLAGASAAEAPAPEGRIDGCIDGLATGEVVEQICIDLGIVAVLFRHAVLGRRIEAVAAEAHALLGGAGRPWTAPPLPPVLHPAADRQRTQWQDIGRQILAFVFVPAPAALADTG
jgi:hypothetical protein